MEGHAWIIVEVTVYGLYAAGISDDGLLGDIGSELSWASFYTTLQATLVSKRN